MKNCIVMALLAAAATLSLADIGSAPKPATTNKLSSAERRMKFFLRYQARKIAKEGGTVVKPDPVRKRTVFFNAQSLVGRADLDSVATIIGERFSIETSVAEMQGKPTMEAVASAVKDRKTGLGVFFVDVPGWPSILVAPESRWAVVNVRALVEDKDEGRLRERFVKEAWRAFAYVGGAANSIQGECLMRPVESLRDLDHLKANNVSPEADMRIKEHLAALGVKPLVKDTYRRACQEGWAPAPTNDIQRAIWEQVKADKERGPTNPITIQPPGRVKSEE